MRIKYKIAVRTLQGQIISFKVDEYQVNNGLIEFWDSKYNMNKKFSINNCEINEIEVDE